MHFLFCSSSLHIKAVPAAVLGTEKRMGSNSRVKAFRLPADSPNQASACQISYKGRCKEYPEQCGMADIVGISTGESKWICIRLDNPRGCSARSSIMPQHDVAYRRIPTTVWVREKFNGLPGVFLDLGLAANDFLLCLLDGQ
jgi:hypothetical protein